jgi:hypothetical protein
MGCSVLHRTVFTNERRKTKNMKKKKKEAEECQKE